MAPLTRSGTRGAASRSVAALTATGERRILAGGALFLLLAAAPVMAAPLGPLRSPFALLVVLPALARALETFGWNERLAAQLARLATRRGRLLASYGAWLATSALLTLDVAAVAAASVGIATGADRDEKRWQLGGAILGANVGSLLLPFSNLTNLVLVAATGLAFGAYVGVALVPQLAAALAVAGLLVVRDRRAATPAGAPTRTLDPTAADSTPPMDAATAAAGLVAGASAVGAVALGLIGGDVAVPFAIAAGAVAGGAVASGRIGVAEVAATLPLAGIGVLLTAAVAAAPIADIAHLVPVPTAGPAGLILATVVGGVLALTVNNLPAAAFGAQWLVRAHPATIVAFLIGTNVVAIATPHGSVATLLARTVGSRHGIELPLRSYVRSAWPYAIAGGVAGLAALILVSR